MASINLGETAEQVLEPGKERNAWLQDAEKLDSYTNDVYRTPEGEYIKMFSELPAEAIRKKVNNPGRPLQRGRKRKFNEKNSTTALNEAGFKAPEIERETATVLMKDEADGRGLDKYFEDEPLYDVHSAAKKFGELLNEFHDLDSGSYALIDSAPRNFTVEEDGMNYTFWCVDSEFFTDRATSEDQQTDLVKFIRNSRTLEPDRYRAVIDGFRDGYGEESENVKPSLLSFPPSPENISRYFQNSLMDIYRY